MNIEDYPVAIMPFDTVAFDKMNKKQAQQHFDTTEMDVQRIVRVVAIKAADGESDEHDFCRLMKYGASTFPK